MQYVEIDVDVNTKLFDVIGRISLFGVWLNWCFTRMYNLSPMKETLNNSRENLQ
jgi:hypothetical protein